MYSMCASRTVEKEEKQEKQDWKLKNATLGSKKFDKIEMWTKLKKAKNENVSKNHWECELVNVDKVDKNKLFRTAIR